MASLYKFSSLDFYPIGLPFVNTLRVFTIWRYNIEIIFSLKSLLIFDKKVTLFRGLKLLPLLLIILRDTKPLGTLYRGLTLGLLGVYSILTSSSLKSIFSRRSPRLFSLEFFSPTIGGSKILIISLVIIITRRSLSSRLYRNIAIDVS